MRSAKQFVMRDTTSAFVKDTASEPSIDTLQAATPAVMRRADTSGKMPVNPFLKISTKPVFHVVSERQRPGKDEIFYLLTGLLFVLAFIRLVFNHYFTNMFRLFFQPTFRQKQTREQLHQNNLPSLLLNLFFVLSAGAYVSFALQYFQLTNLGFWLTFIYSCICLAFIYFGKYVFLVFAGWVFNVREASEAYVFSVYLINKIIGVVLIPFTLIIAFSPSIIVTASIPLSIVIVLLLFGYRYVLSIAPVSKQVKVSPLHFLLYICACEVVPLLVIYKTLNTYLSHSL